MNRRDFLKQSAGIATAVVAGPSIAAAVISEAVARGGTTRLTATAGVADVMISVPWGSPHFPTPFADMLAWRMQVQNESKTTVRWSPITLEGTEGTDLRLRQRGWIQPDEDEIRK